MNNQTSNERALSMSLHDLGLTPRSGYALCALLRENHEKFEILASRPRNCRGKDGVCGSCGSRPDECRAVLHQLPKASAWRILKIWSKYFQKKGRLDCSVSSFLMPALKTLLNALFEQGLDPNYLKTEFPDAKEILEFGTPMCAMARV